MFPEKSFSKSEVQITPETIEGYIREITPSDDPKKIELESSNAQAIFQKFKDEGDTDEQAFAKVRHFWSESLPRDEEHTALFEKVNQEEEEDQFVQRQTPRAIELAQRLNHMQEMVRKTHPVNFEELEAQHEKVVYTAFNFVKARLAEYAESGLARDEAMHLVLNDLTDLVERFSNEYTMSEKEVNRAAEQDYREKLNQDTARAIAEKTYIHVKPFLDELYLN